MTDKDIPPRVPDALPPGYQLDEFEIQEVIDSANEGIVYRALDQQLERQVTIREFMPRALTIRNEDMHLLLRSEKDSAAFNAGLNNFILEARQLSRFIHPNLIQVLRFWMLNGTVYVATPFYSGVTLAELHQQQPEIIDDAWIHGMLPVVCGALAAMHAGGYIHQDITLKSIQIQDNGIPLLLNASTTRHNINGLLDDTRNLLHPGFAPIEQYTDDLENRPGPWSDIYSLGAVLYTLITGTCPPASVTRIIQDHCKPLAETYAEHYSLPLLTAIDHALALKPEARPQSIEEFAALAEITIGDAGGISHVEKPGTMLVPVADDENEGEPAAWRRYKSPLQITTALLAGVIVGALIFGNYITHRAEQKTAQPTLPAPSSPESPTQNAGASDSQEARIYVRMFDGEQLEINGQSQKVMPTVNGFGFLQLPQGEYNLVLRSRTQSRSITLNVNQPGTWLVNPQK